MQANATPVEAYTVIDRQWPAVASIAMSV